MVLSFIKDKNVNFAGFIFYNAKKSQTLRLGIIKNKG